MSDANSKSNPLSRRFASLFAASHSKRTFEYTTVYTLGQQPVARDWKELDPPVKNDRCESHLAALPKRSAEERAELAMALWESLTDQERESELEPSDEQRADLDRRWADRVANPESAIPVRFGNS